MVFQNEKEVDDYVNSLTKEQLKQFTKKQLMRIVKKEQQPVYEEGTFGHLLEQHCNKPFYCSVGFELYDNKNNEEVFYYDYEIHKPFAEISKVFEKYLHCKIKKVSSVGDHRTFRLNSGFGSLYRILLEI